MTIRPKVKIHSLQRSKRLGASGRFGHISKGAIHMKSRICPFMSGTACRRERCACWTPELNQCGLVPDLNMVAEAIAIHARCTAAQTANVAQVVHELERSFSAFTQNNTNK